MGGIGISSLALVALAALPAPAAAADVCAAFDRIVAASRERPAFASLRQTLANGGALVPGFEAGSCEIIAAAQIRCTENGFTDPFRDWAGAASCPGVVAVTPHPRPPRRRDLAVALVASGLRLEYGVDCRLCAGPSTSFFFVAFEGRALPDD
jgi:hypothetical protein